MDRNKYCDYGGGIWLQSQLLDKPLPCFQRDTIVRVMQCVRLTDETYVGLSKDSTATRVCAGSKVKCMQLVSSECYLLKKESK